MKRHLIHWPKIAVQTVCIINSLTGPVLFLWPCIVSLKPILNGGMKYQIVVVLVAVWFHSQFCLLFYRVYVKKVERWNLGNVNVD